MGEDILEIVAISVPEEPKFCKDCKHFVPKPRPDSLVQDNCINPDVLRGVERTMRVSQYLVTGEKPVVTEFSAYMSRMIGVCGQDAIHFEPKDQTDVE